MEYKGYTQGNIVVLTKPLPVPDGTEVEILSPAEAKPRIRKGRKKPSVAMETFGLIPADPALVRKVLLEDLYTYSCLTLCPSLNKHLQVSSAKPDPNSA